MQGKVLPQRRFLRLASLQCHDASPQCLVCTACTSLTRGLPHNPPLSPALLSNPSEAHFPLIAHLYPVWDRGQFQVWLDGFDVTEVEYATNDFHMEVWSFH